MTRQLPPNIEAIPRITSPRPSISEAACSRADRAVAVFLPVRSTTDTAISIPPLHLLASLYRRWYSLNQYSGRGQNSVLRRPGLSVRFAGKRTWLGDL